MVVENWEINRVYFRQCDNDMFLAVSIKDTIKKNCKSHNITSREIISLFDLISFGLRDT